MISPHGIVRERALFIQSVERDRERRHLGLPDLPKPERHGGRHPLTEPGLLDLVRADVGLNRIGG